MPDWAQIISDALDILKFDGAVQDTLAELREKWGAQVPALLDERFDAVGVQYMKLSHEKGAAALGQELSAFGWALYNLDDEDEYLFALIPEEERSEWERYCKKQGQYCHLMKQQGRKWGDHAKGPDACAIHAPEDGSGLTLQFIGEYRPHTELPNLRGLHGIELKDFDLTGLAAVHPHLKELRLWGAPGNLGSFSAVGGFRELTNLSTFDLFGFGADDIPTPEQMPELRWFWMTSLPETAAKAAKQLWKSKPGMDLRITKPRKPEWLAQNLDNPFRGWDGAEHIPAAAAKKAANQYRKTRSLLMKLAAEPGEDAQAQALDAVAAYTQTFNKMGFIETEKRDEIYMALRGILDALPDGTLQKDALMEKFEQLRDF